ncbi:MAG: sugar ABC transporter permease [Chloroflexi bacterium]|nr:MAG: sugar ABC transporter permease [Chloroflexota bacterium]
MTAVRGRLLTLGMLAPALAFVLGVIAYPLATALWFSLTSVQIGGAGHFVGLANYSFLFGLGTYGDAVRDTVVYTAGSTALKAVFGLLLAFSLARPFPGRRIVYAVLFLPFIFPADMGAVAWYYLFSNVHGGINYLIQRDVAWLGTGPLAMASLITVNVWHGTALFTVLVLAALRSVPGNLVDAAVIDGARWYQRFLRIVLPYLVPGLALAALLSVLGTFGDFVFVYLITGGGPANSTSIVGTMAFEVGLLNGDLGLASAISFSVIPVYLIGLVYLLRLVAGR